MTAPTGPAVPPALMVTSAPGTGGLNPPPLNAPAAVPPLPGVQAGTTSAIDFARAVIIFGSNTAFGLFVYEGTPATGNPPILSITESTTDFFGNVVAPLLNIGPLAGAHVNFDNNAVQYLADATGAVRIMLDPENRVIEFFDASGINANPPLISIASQGGNDRFTGDPFFAGLTLTNNAGGTSGLWLKSGAAFENGIVNMGTFVSGAPGDQVINYVIQGPSVTAPNGGSVRIQMVSQDQGGSNTPAGFLVATTAGGTQVVPLEWTTQGAVIVGSIVANHPGSSVQTGETPQTLSLASSWTGSLRYWAMADSNMIWIEADIHSDTTTALTVGTLPSGYRPSGTRVIPLSGQLNVAGTGPPPSLSIASSGVITVQGIHALATVGEFVGGSGFSIP